jgi:choline dehydrogenase-like flavoprotein
MSEWLQAAKPEPPGTDKDTVGSFHHMCTTRMSDNPREGVVDRDCRVHGIQNLYIGGSSVFATAGYAHPTYTIVQLALRLAEHLDGKLRS